MIRPVSQQTCQTTHFFVKAQIIITSNHYYSSWSRYSTNQFHYFKLVLLIEQHTGNSGYVQQCFLLHFLNRVQQDPFCAIEKSFAMTHLNLSPHRIECIAERGFLAHLYLIHGRFQNVLVVSTDKHALLKYCVNFASFTFFHS